MKATEVKLPLIRLHILANSDQSFDQEIKFKIRDKLLQFLRPELTRLKDLSQARRLLQKQQKAILQLGRDYLQKTGVKYGIRGQWGVFAFPACHYRFQRTDYFLPAGNYEALRLVLGSGQGKNWFCVLFPDLCGLEAEPQEEEEMESKIWEWFKNW